MNDYLINQEALKRAQQTVSGILSSEDRLVAYRTSRPVTDIRHMFHTSVELYGDHTAFMQRFVKGEPFREITYREALDDINAFGSALTDLGLQGRRIAVIGENCYQWAITYLTVLSGVGIIVPLDKELPAAELAQLVENAQVSAVVFTKKFEPVFRDIKANSDQLQILVNVNAGENTEEVYSQKALIRRGRELLASGDRRYLDAEIDPEAMSVLLFTSGTTGIAKGVMLSQRSLCFELMSAPTVLNVNDWDIFFSVLPVHHTYECTGGFLMPLYKGAAIAYCEGLKYIQKNLKEVEPTMILAVPLIFESLYKAIWKNIRKQGKEASVKKVMKTCKKLGAVGLKLQKKLLKDVYAVFGSRMRVLISGGAAIDPAILEFFNDLGYVAVQGYGLTECAPMAALNPDTRGDYRSDSVGHLLYGMECRIDDPDDSGVGEICLKGDNVMMGYYQMPEETAKVLRDGWFHTGDLGYIDKDNFIYITGRSKNVIIAANGKNVFPEELEYYLGKIPYVAESMVWADKDEKGADSVIVATVYPDRDAVKEAAGEYSAEAAQKLLEEAVSKINDDLPIFKQIRRVIVREEEFEKTTGKKIKRFVESNKKA